MKILALIILSVVFCHRQNEAVAKTVYIRDASIDVCFETRTLAVYVEVDPIAATDSILGFDVSLTYNPELVVFDRLLPIGTISESISEKELKGTFNRPGVANALGFKVSQFLQSSERRALIGFIGRIKGDCAQEITLELAAASFAIATPTSVREENAEIDGLSTLKAEERASEKREVSFSFESENEIEFEEGSFQTAETTLSFQRGEETRNSSVDLELSFDKDDVFSIRAIESLEKGIVLKNVEIAEDGNSATFSCDFSESDNLEIDEFLRIELRNERDIDTTAELVLRPIQADTCSCITNMLGSSLILKSQKKVIPTDTDVSLSDSNGKTISISLINGPGEWLIEIDSEVEMLDAVIIYDLLGQVVLQQRISNGQRWVRIPNENMAAGMYLGRVITKAGNYLALNMSK